MSERILVIKLGALGDLILCMGAFSAIRKHHPGAHIALQTMPSFADFAREMPWFDEILIDPRPKFSQPRKWADLIRTTRKFNPTRVYDFQGKLRQSLLYFALGGPLSGPEWSGAAPACSHPRPWPPVPGMHYTDFLAAQLEQAGLTIDSAPDLSWLDAPLDGFALPKRFALFIPGCAPTRLYKRWPPESYAELAKRFEEQGIAAVTVGTQSDATSIVAIRAIAPQVIDLTGKTSLKQLAALARRAVCVVGNDTGPTHLAAAVGARTLALMSDQVDPNWSAPKGSLTAWLGGGPLDGLGVQTVWDKLFEV